MAPTPLEDVARCALGGDRDAVERLVRELQGDVYGLALRMLWNREDAEDATQEILVRVVTRLSQFDFRSTLKTWVYRIAVNYILDVKKSPIERMHLHFQGFAEDLLEGLSSEGPADAERSVLVEEVKIGCTLGMLQCLDRQHRLAYILGEILDLSGPEAADALGISPDLFRKRLQHARAAIEAFTRAHCGLASDTAACSCHRRVRPPFAWAASVPMRSISPNGQRPFRRVVSLCAVSSTRDGRFTSTAPVSHGRRPSISHAISHSPSTRRGTRSHSFCSRRRLSNARSFLFALPIMNDINGASHVANPLGVPRLRSVIRVAPSSSSHV